MVSPVPGFIVPMSCFDALPAGIQTPAQESPLDEKVVLMLDQFAIYFATLVDAKDALMMLDQSEIQGVATCILVGTVFDAIYCVTADRFRWSKLFLYVGMLCYIDAIFNALNINDVLCMLCLLLVCCLVSIFCAVIYTTGRGSRFLLYAIGLCHCVIGLTVFCLSWLFPVLILFLVYVIVVFALYFSGPKDGSDAEGGLDSNASNSSPFV